MRAGKAILVATAIACAAGLLRAQQGPPPQFRADVEYVEVDARVLDQQGQPIHGLTQRDFAVFENGVRQTLTNFSVVDIPVPTAATGPVGPAPVKPDIGTNTQGGGERRRTYLILFDGPSVSVRWTAEVRSFLRGFVERSVGADDLVGIATTGCDSAYENFTNSKPRLIATINRMVGQLEYSCFGGPNDPTDRSGSTLIRATDARQRQRQRQLIEIIHAMSSASPGSKAIIYVSQDVPFDVVSNTEGLTLIGDTEGVAAQARRGNVPIYPVDPRGLSSGFESSAEVPLVGLTDQDPAIAALNEVRRGQENLRILADDSGGVPIVGVNRIDAGLDRVVMMSSFYYVLGYYSTNHRRDGKYRKLNITVDRPGARVFNRRGYTAAITGGSKGPSLAGPPKSSIELREALNAVLPASSLSMQTTAAAFRGMNNRASVAVVVEMLGSELTWQNGALTAPVEMAAVAMDKRGGIKQGEDGRVQLSRGATADRVKQFGLRWLARLNDLKPGRYQIRAASANGPSKQGSVWYDIEIPDFSKDPLTMSDVMLASAVAMLRPTLRPDKLLVDALPGPPTTLREFPEGGSVALYAEVYDNQLDRPHDVETTVVVTNERGETAFRKVDVHTSREIGDSHGVIPVSVGVPLVNIKPGHYTLTVDARQTTNRAISTGRALPFQVVRPGGS